jgi:hypothetical protein
VKATALQRIRIEDVEVCLGKVDLTPIAGAKLRNPMQAIVEKASISLDAGKSAEGFLPGYWWIRCDDALPAPHPRLSAPEGDRVRLDTFDLGKEDLPLEIPGLIRVER